MSGVPLIAAAAPLVALALACGRLDAGEADQTTTVQITSSADGSRQPSRVAVADDADGPRPLLVSLHTWGGDVNQPAAPREAWCRERNWHFIHPHFRGPNRKPDACGSDKAVADIVDAVAWMQATHRVDPERIYLAGGSGGGHMALLLAGRHPELWAGVSAWVPIADLEKWWAFHGGKGYGRDIAQACGGPPGKDDAVAEAYRRRSPVTWLAAARNLPLDINGGLHDGRDKASVPFSHSLWAFNAAVPEADRLPEADIEAFFETQTIPAGWGERAAPDPLYGHLAPVYRKTAGNARVTIFDGGHNMAERAALTWLAAQRKGRPAVWDLGDDAAGDAGADEEVAR